MPRGQDVWISVKVDGEVHEAIAEIQSAEWDPGFEQEVLNYLGQKQPTVEGYSRESSVRVTFVPGSSSLLGLLELQRRKNLPFTEDEDAETAEAREKQIDVAFAMRFPGGRALKVQLPNCTLTSGGLNVAGRTDKVTSQATFTAGGWRSLGEIA